MNLSRRNFIRKLALGSAGAAAGLTVSYSAAQDILSVTGPAQQRLSISDDSWIGGYKACYHGRAKDPKHWVDLVTVVGRSGGASAGFVRRWVIAIAESPQEANEGIAYLNRGIKDRWLIHGRPRSCGMPLGNLKSYYEDVPSYVGTVLQDLR